MQHTPSLMYDSFKKKHTGHPHLCIYILESCVVVFGVLTAELDVIV